MSPDLSAQSASQGATTTPSGNYLNLQPRRRAPKPAWDRAPLVQPTAQVAAPRRDRTVVCGMTVFESDNAVDQKMVQVRPEDRVGAARPFALPMCVDRPAPTRR